MRGVTDRQQQIVRIARPHLLELFRRERVGRPAGCIQFPQQVVIRRELGERRDAAVGTRQGQSQLRVEHQHVVADQYARQ